MRQELDPASAVLDRFARKLRPKVEVANLRALREQRDQTFDRGRAVPEFVGTRVQDRLRIVEARDLVRWPERAPGDVLV